MCTYVYSDSSSVCLFLEHSEDFLFQPFFVMWDVSVGCRLMAAREQIQANHFTTFTTFDAYAACSRQGELEDGS